MARAKTVEDINLAIESEAIEPGPPDAFGSVPLFVGIDVAKNAHVAGFVSQALIAERGRIEKCPVLVFENSRKGFNLLLAQISARCAPGEATILLEHTGHYHRALEQFLLEQGVTLFIMHVRARPDTHSKTDRRDALGLANRIYSQIAKGVEFDDKSRQARLASMPNETSLRLHGLVQRRYEIAHDVTRRENKLTSIIDELFPEFTTALKNPNLPTALRIREAFPTPALYATALISAILALRKGTRPSTAALLALQKLAAESIGTRNPARIECLILEQAQIIAELKLLQKHLEALNTKITEIITSSREGKILMSINGVGPMLAAAAVATMGSISRFATPARLKKYFGWAPAEEQTGISKDRSFLSRGGSRLMKQLLYLSVLNAVRLEGAWQVYYDRMVLRKCSFDERTQRWTGKKKVLGHVCGRMIEVMWLLLWQDAQLLASLPPGAELPDPQLYDAAKHLKAMQHPSQGRRQYKKNAPATQL